MNKEFKDLENGIMRAKCARHSTPWWSVDVGVFSPQFNRLRYSRRAAVRDGRRSVISPSTRLDSSTRKKKIIKRRKMIFYTGIRVACDGLLIPQHLISPVAQRRIFSDLLMLTNLNLFRLWIWFSSMAFFFLSLSLSLFPTSLPPCVVKSRRGRYGPRTPTNSFDRLVTYCI